MRDRAKALQSKVLGAIHRHGLLRAGERVAVAVSGGADSVALLHLLDDLKAELGLRLVVLHCNHQLRGAEADADERFVAELASRLELEFLVVREDVRRRAERERRNVEDTARRWRLGVFRALVDAGRMDRVALGHTADDQAETVLLRLLRGSGTRGLAGIYPVVQGYLIRPLLDVRRTELREFLSARGETWREDTSNLNLSLARNRLRHELLPLLEKFSPALVARLTSLAERSRAEEAFWSALVEPLVAEHARREAGSAVIAAAVLAAPPLGIARALPSEAQMALARRLVRRILEEVQGDLARLTSKHIDAVLALATRPSSGRRLVLPGEVIVRRSFDQLVFERQVGAEPLASAEYCYSVRVPGSVAVPEVGQEFSFILVDREALGRRYNGSPPALDSSRVEAELVVRNWRAGDAYRPRGTVRRKKVKELFQARKIPRSERARWPVVLSGKEIVWVRGWPVAGDCTVSDTTRQAILIEEKPL